MERKSRCVCLCGVERHARGVGHLCVSLVLNPRDLACVGRPRLTRGATPPVGVAASCPCRPLELRTIPFL